MQRILLRQFMSPVALLLPLLAQFLWFLFYKQTLCGAMTVIWARQVVKVLRHASGDV